ncbi:alpha/beta hydrolase [Mesorhizobium sp. LHD-90]|uniref:alpha/beta hydrolase n=1 Tax=Mesorhizobium sp. LHD-90 TaxID=3071414 RepID=UPI0027DEE162|nr:alpha/beta hydrolase [Mesorhizobium sp. LHD-90]MDQ6436759.1 alpha/beta hydrolase [Mesorhizobium sp. LHD-90]
MAHLRALCCASLVSFALAIPARAQDACVLEPDQALELSALPDTVAQEKKPAACAAAKTGTKDAMAKKPAAAPRKSKLPEAAAALIQHTKHFKVAYRRPQDASDETLVLLHGSGGDETTLMPLASRLAPQAALMGVAGRVTQEGTSRWYQRITATSFDQTDIRAEAEAFAAFLQDAVKSKKLDLGRTVFIGYSNGANLLGALSLLHPGLVQRAVLLRPMPVLDAAPVADLSKTRFLTVVGVNDELYAPYGPTLEAILRERGARVDARTVKAGHLLGEEDVKVVADWLAASDAVSLNR